MPSTLHVTALRQTEEERKKLSALAKKRAISASRTLQQLVNEEYERLYGKDEPPRSSADSSGDEREIAQKAESL